MIDSFSRALGGKLASYLSKSQPGYRLLETFSIEDVANVLKTGDIVLVEGNSRISIAIKYLTQSSWSHACLFVGSDGDAAEKETLLEADLVEGARMVNLKHYEEFNLRICRPVSLTEQDKKMLIGFAKSKLGHKYDLKNVFDLARYIIQKPPVPNRGRHKICGVTP